MLPGLWAEVPGINKLKIRWRLGIQLRKLKLSGTGITFADKRLRSNLSVLDQKIETRGNRCLTAAAGSVQLSAGHEGLCHPRNQHGWPVCHSAC